MNDDDVAGRELLATMRMHGYNDCLMIAVLNAGRANLSNRYEALPPEPIGEVLHLESTEIAIERLGPAICIARPREICSNAPRRDRRVSVPEFVTHVVHSGSERKFPQTLALRRMICIRMI